MIPRSCIPDTLDLNYSIADTQELVWKFLQYKFLWYAQVKLNK